MTNLKSYKEKQNEIVEKMQSILSSAKLETRALSSDEKTEYENLKAELDAIKETIKLLQEEIKIEEPMTEEKGKEMTEQRSLSKELLQNKKIEIKAEKRALQATVNPGQKLVSTGVDSSIIELVSNDNDLLAHIPFVPTNDGNMVFCKETSMGDTPEFLAEGASIADNDPSIENVVVTSARIGASTTISKKLAHSTTVDVAQYVQKLLGRKISKGINKALIKGATVNGAVVTDGLEQVVTTGDVTIKTTGVLTIQDVMSLLIAMPRDYVQNSKFVCSTEIFNQLSQLQTADGAYYMVQSIVNDRPVYKLFGLEVLINDEINSNLTEDKDILYLVNFQEAYRGIVKESLNIELVEFEAQKRAGTYLAIGDMWVGARVVNANAMKRLKAKA